MVVFVVLCDHCYDGYNIVGVFSTQDRAQEYVDKRVVGIGDDIRFYDFLVETYEVDES